MAPRINTRSDKGYKCLDDICTLTDLVRAQVNDEDWTCVACKTPVYVKKLNTAEREILVRRVRAQDVVIGDQVYVGHNFDVAYLVKGSEMGREKTNSHLWVLKMADNGGVQYKMPDEYVNIA
ncbi:hypothetical protein SAMN05216248_10362 [Pseudomonas simiae]|uniref:hypothetical protein n=1 Tax=Pseudomonas simiae TaxID=321846 RepID=UPI00084DA2BF|nr:hypothetical protein [Pseudomonas simiae]SFB14768.1 hypothetical protein SAMN05216248_10362 [Pseudomonas simiae]